MFSRFGRQIVAVACGLGLVGSLLAEAKKPFDIPRGTAESSLKLFIAQSGAEVVYPAEIVRGVSTPAVKGDLTSAAALRQLLAATTLSVTWDDKNRTFLISRSPKAARTAQPGPVAQSDRPVQDPVDETPIMLSPFEVVGEEDGGYLATHTLAGTRFNSQLRDVPASLSVMTAEFLQDVGALNVNQALEYTIGAEEDREDTTGNAFQGSDLALRMRGFRFSTLSRNFFESGNSADNYNTERITFSRGPNAILFGTGGAGGIADASTKRANRRAITSLVTRIGSYDDRRFEVDVNRPVAKSLAVRLNTLFHKKQGWRDWEYMDRRSAAFAVTWRPFERTSLRLDSEYGNVRQLKPQPWPAMNAVSPWIEAGRPISQTYGAPVAATGAINNPQPYFIQNTGRVLTSLRNSRVTNAAPAPFGSTANGIMAMLDESIVSFRNFIGGPGQTTDNDFANVGLFWELRLFRNLFIEATVNTQTIHMVRNRFLSFNEMTVRADPNARLPDGSANPYVGQYYVENAVGITRDFNNTRSDDFRLTASYSFAAGRLGRHQVGAMLTRRNNYNRSSVRAEAWINNPAQRNYTNSANLIHRRTYVSFHGDNPYGLPSYHYNPLEHPINSGGLQSGWYDRSRADNLNRLDSEVGVLRSHFFADRFVTTLGVRQDKLATWGSRYTRDPVTQAVLAATRNQDPTSRSSGRTYTVGAVWHLLSWLSLSANASTNSTPQGGMVFQIDGPNKNESLGRRKGEGMDLGARVALLDKRVFGSIAYYETAEKNSYRSVPDSWSPWLEDAYRVTDQTPSNVRIAGADTVDIVGHGWESEWVVNWSRNLRFVVNGGKAVTLGSNQFPRVTGLARAILPLLRALPADTPTAGRGGATTTGALVQILEAQAANNVRTEGLPIRQSRKYSANAFVNYQFSAGRLKGWGLGIGLNSRGPQIAGYHSVTNAPIYGGATNYVNAQLRYQRSLTFGGRKIDWNVQLLGTNIFGRARDHFGTSADENGVYRIYFVTPPAIALINRFGF